MIPRTSRLCFARLLPGIALVLSLAFGGATAAEIGSVEGIPITEEAFARLSKPYFDEVQARVNRALTTDEKKLLERNVLDELIRERLWIADARRRGMKVSEDSLDARIKRLPSFRINGRVDEAKFRAYKLSRSSNYRELRTQVEDSLLLERYVALMESRYAPRETEIKKIFAQRTEQARLRYIWLTPELFSLDPSASAGAIRAYYEAHPDEFQSPDSARITYARIPFGAGTGATDLVRAAARQAAADEAAELIAQLARGAPASTAAKAHGGPVESGWFRLGDPIRGLGRSSVIVDAIRRAPLRTWVPEPVEVGPNWVVFRVDEHRPPHLLRFGEAVALAKQRADDIARGSALDSLASLLYREEPDRFRTPRLTATVIARSLNSFRDDRPVGDRDIRRALDRYRATGAVSETTRAWSDSMLAALPEAIRRDRSIERGMKTLQEAAERLRRGERGEAVASRLAARSFAFSLYHGEPPAAPLLVEGALLESLYVMPRGTVIGPRARTDSLFVARVEEVDGHYVPPLSAIKEQARAAVTERESERQEAQARGYFDSHRGDYLTPRRWRFDYALFQRAAPESVPVPPDSIAAYYAGHPNEFTEPARARARHILIANRPSDGPAARAAALERARAALKRVRAGEDFSALALELSDDRASAVRGGDLGEFARSTMVKEFADATFALEPGGISDVVETQYGFHIIKLEEKTPQRLRPLAECRLEIQQLLGGELADSLAHQGAVSFAIAAARAPQKFDSLAALGRGLHHGPPLGANEPIPEVGPIPEIERAIGGLSPGGVTPAPIQVAHGYIVARLVEAVPQVEAGYAESKDRALFDYQHTLRKAVADSVEAVLRAALAHRQGIDSLLVPLGGFRTTRFFGRFGPIPDFNRDPELAQDSTFLARIFSARPGSTLPPQASRFGALFAVVDTIAAPPPAEYAKTRESVRREILDQRIEAWTARLRARADIRIARRDLYP